MRRLFSGLSILKALLVWCIGCVWLVQAASLDLPKQLEQLLDKSGLVLNVPNNFEALQPARNALLAYEFAAKHPELKLAVRYAIRPINMVDIDYDDPHSSAPEPNHLFPMLFNTLIANLADKGKSPRQEYSAADAQNKFRADWASAVVMDVVPEFGQGYQQMLLIAIHKNHLADAYLMVLFDDYAAIKPAIKPLLSSLQFKSTP